MFRRVGTRGQASGASANAALIWDESADMFKFANVGSASAESTGLQHVRLQECDCPRSGKVKLLVQHHVCYILHQRQGTKVL